MRSNGVRISPSDPANPKVVAAGTQFTITVTYTGSNPEFSFLSTPNGVAWMKAQNPAWSSITGPAFPAPVLRPEDGSIKFTGTAIIAPGGDFPEGGTLVNMLVDPKGGTGALSGPTPESWSEV